jgi:hypothetical protein
LSSKTIQIQEGEIMRKNIGSLAFVLLALLSAAAYAQDEASVSIPFGFVIKGRAFPAGSYILSRHVDSQVLFLRRDGSPSDAAFILVRPHSDEKNDHFEFQFSKTGDDIFLTGIRTRLGDAHLPTARPKGTAGAHGEAKTLAAERAGK